MKKILIFGVAFFTVFSLVSCSNAKECDDPDPIFRVRPGNLTFDLDAEEPQVIDVITSSDVSWKAEVEVAAQEWMEITTEADRMIVSVAKNTTDADRTGKIIVKPDNNTVNAEEVTVLQTSVKIIEITPTKAVLHFWNDYYQCGFSNYALMMGDGDIEYNEGTGGFLVNTGYFINFDILTEDITIRDYQKVDLKEGTYKGSMNRNDPDFEFEKMSFIVTQVEEKPDVVYFNYSLILRYEEGELVERLVIPDGEIIVKNEDGNYTLVADLPLSDREKIIIKYTGEFDAKINEVASSTYETALNLSGLNTGTIEFYGSDKIIHPDIYSWIVKIEVPGYDNVSELMLSLFSPNTDPTILDDGPYKIINVYQYEPFIAKAGFKVFYNISGTWVYNLIDGELTDSAPLIDGTVNVTHNGGDNYTIEVDAVMDNYNSCKASFMGDLEYVDMTVLPGPEEAPYHKIHSGKVIPNVGSDKKVAATNSLYK